MKKKKQQQQQQKNNNKKTRKTLMNQSWEKCHQTERWIER